MSRKDKFGLIGFLGIIITTIVLILAVAYYQGTLEGPEDCYANLPTYYSWESLRPLLQEYTEDSFLTISECRNINAAYATAVTEQTRRTKMQEYRDVSK